jgi:hypothetical protein
MDVRAAEKKLLNLTVARLRRVYLLCGTGYITIQEKHTLTTEFLEYNSGRSSKRATSGPTKSLSSWTAYRSAYRSASSILSDYARTFMTRLSHASQRSATPMRRYD